MHVGGGVSRHFQAVPEGSRGLQGPPEPQKTPQTCFEQKKHPAAYCQSLEFWARLKFHVGWSGWTRPPTMAGGVGGGLEKSRGFFFRDLFALKLDASANRVCLPLRLSPADGLW